MDCGPLYTLTQFLSQNNHMRIKNIGLFVLKEKEIVVFKFG